MTSEIKVPLLPESVADATISTWYKKPGDTVKRDENLVDIETDKVVLEVVAPADGVLDKITKETGSVVKAEEVIGMFSPQTIDNATTPKSTAEAKPAPVPTAEAKPVPAAEAKPAPAPAAEAKPVPAAEAKPVPATETKPVPAAEAKPAPAVEAKVEPKVEPQMGSLSPSERRALKELDSVPAQNNVVNNTKPSNVSTNIPSDGRLEKRVPMTRLRAKIAERLLAAQQNAAILTTFNEVNMAPVIALRNNYKEEFLKKYDVRLGFMSFFVMAVVAALKRFPIVNASIDGNDIVYHGYFDIGIAVSTERGLVVPVLRDADTLTMAEIEQKITDFGKRAKDGKLTMEELTGGTFTITNGGVYGSLMSTPILNPPQSAILGVHKIEERPVVENKQIVIRPMTYVALSYDHRIIDGAESVQFLVAIKELLEDPARLLLSV